ncbi:MAG: hypothetical protein JW951_06645 [Lentisphaerae bacterium]|nr:hypothetical protein [Lentisphaerota bacterium]
MKRAALLCALMIMASALARIGHAELTVFDGRMVDVEYWAGNGPKQAMLVVDFEPGVSFAFGYRFDGAPTGFDMLAALADAGALEFGYNTDYGDPFVDTIRYKGFSAGVRGGYPADWLAYYTGCDGYTWLMSPVGSVDRVLADGHWDGWARETSGAWPPPNVPKTSPQNISVLEGTEALNRGIEKVDGRWQRVKPHTRGLLTIVYHDDVTVRDTVRVCGIDVSYPENGRAPESFMLPGLTMNYRNGNYTGDIKESIGADIVVGRLTARGTPDRMDVLTGILNVLERGERGRPQAFYQYLWDVSD